ncbi:AAA family ATPase [uncultured Bacteroides sp.]|uniref:AAA family ATPase n=1 Tax=uncultured Bacteroides sp. TaxID=162156 RepID=UPI002AAAA6E3|nr:AAA family ATPase [uncultured Bacteroides sp.]
MKIQEIRIEKLFNRFDYSFALNNQERLSIITGPNGFGKTTVLNIIQSVFNKQLYYLQSLVFSSISITFDDSSNLKIEKKEVTSHELLISLESLGHEKISSKVSANEDVLFRQIERMIPIKRVADNLWEDRRTGNLHTKEELLDLNSHEFAGIKSYKIDKPEILEILDSIQVYLIKEQRLLRKKENHRYPSLEGNITYTNTIQEYSKDLQTLIRESKSIAFQKSLILDSTFPKRLMQDDKKINLLSKDDFENRYEKIKGKQQSIKKYGLFDVSLEDYSYSDDNALLLTTYLNDTEEKLSFFDNLLEKLELFTTILNEKRFAFKKIIVNEKCGFEFVTDEGDPLALKALSSGEQHEVVLLYELLFQTQNNVLVLIDEPEISLHVAWQLSFVEDLHNISKLMNIDIMIATHSPQIINDRWDLVTDLYKLYKNQN